MTQQVHLFVDNSNIIGGAQRLAFERDGAPWMATRVYWRNFFRLIEGSMLPATRVLAGSLPPGNEELWEYSRKHGYDTTLLRRVQRDDGRLGEQAVDEVLHARIAGVLLDYSSPPEQVLVLATGDGNLSEFGTSFLQQVSRAVRLGWKVKIYSWRAQLSRKFSQVRAAHPEQIEVVYLDDFYRSITFVKGGDYRVESKDVHIADRIVSAL